MTLRVKTNSQIVTWTAFTILARMSFSEGNSDTKLVVFYFQILLLVVNCLGLNPWRYVWAVWERRGRINPCVIEKHKSRAKCLLEWDRPRTKDMKKGIIAMIPFFISSTLHQKIMFWMKICREINFQSWIFPDIFF